MYEATDGLDYLITQYRDSRRLRALIRAILNVSDQQILSVSDQLERCLNIDLASGYWLDRMGRLLGLKRPSILTAIYDDVIRFGVRGAGFGNFPFVQSEMLTREPLGDSDYRRLIKSRIITLRSGCTLVEYREALAYLDSTATVSDNLDLTYTVTTVNPILVVLAERYHALPATIGVTRLFA